MNTQRSRARGRAVLDEAGVSDEQRARVHTPAGLPIGARSPEEIALAILAEIVSVLRAGEADHRASRPSVEVPATVAAEHMVSAG